MTDINHIKGVGVSIEAWESGKLANNCPWNIAKQQVMQKHNCSSTGANENYLQEINELTDDIMELNNIKSANDFDKMFQEERAIILPLEYAQEEISASLENATNAVSNATTAVNNAQTSLSKATSDTASALATLNSTEPTIEETTGEGENKKTTATPNPAYATALASYQKALQVQQDAQSKLESAQTELEAKQAEAQELQTELETKQKDLKSKKTELDKKGDEAKAEQKQIDNQIKALEAQKEQLKAAQKAAEQAKRETAETNGISEAANNNIEAAKSLGFINDDGTVVSADEAKKIEIDKDSNEFKKALKTTTGVSYDLGEDGKVTKNVTGTDGKTNPFGMGDVTEISLTDNNAVYTGKKDNQGRDLYKINDEEVYEENGKYYNKNGEEVASAPKSTYSFVNETEDTGTSGGKKDTTSSDASGSDGKKAENSDDSISLSSDTAMKPDGTFTKINGKEVASTEINEETGEITYKDTKGNVIGKGKTIKYDGWDRGVKYEGSTTQLTDKDGNDILDYQTYEYQEFKQTGLTLYNKNGTEKETKVTETDAEGKTIETITEYDENGKETKVIETDAEGKTTEKTSATVTRNGKVLDVYKDGDGYISKDGKTKYNANGLITETTDTAIQKELKQDWANAQAEIIMANLLDPTRENENYSIINDVFTVGIENGGTTKSVLINQDDMKLIAEAYKERTGCNLYEDLEFWSGRDENSYIDTFTAVADTLKSGKTVLGQEYSNEQVTVISEKDILDKKVEAFITTTTKTNNAHSNTLANLFAELDDYQIEYFNNTVEQKSGQTTKELLTNNQTKDDEGGTFANTFSDKLASSSDDIHTKDLGLYGKTGLDDSTYSKYVDNLAAMAGYIRAAIKNDKSEKNALVEYINGLNEYEKHDLEIVFNELYQFDDQTSLKSLIEAAADSYKEERGPWGWQKDNDFKSTTRKALKGNYTNENDPKGASKNDYDYENVTNYSITELRKKELEMSVQHRKDSEITIKNMFISGNATLTDEEIYNLVNEYDSIDAINQILDEIDNEALRKAIKAKVQSAYNNHQNG